MKSGVSSSFLPEKMNRHRITPARTAPIKPLRKNNFSNLNANGKNSLTYVIKSFLF